MNSSATSKKHWWNFQRQQSDPHIPVPHSFDAVRHYYHDILVSCVSGVVPGTGSGL